MRSSCINLKVDGIYPYAIVLIAIDLAMDVFSVSTVTGLVLQKINLGILSKLSISFGAFHFLMPVLGWLLSSQVLDVIAGYDHWAALLLLLFVGSKMIYGALFQKTETVKVLNGFDLLLSSIAVSIDALAIGLTFYLEQIAPLVPIIVIGLFASLFTILGIVLGVKTG